MGKRMVREKTGTSETDTSENMQIKETFKHEITNKPASQQGSKDLQQKIHSSTETAFGNFVNDRKKDCTRMSNDEVIDLFYSIFEEFSKEKCEPQMNEVQMSDKRQKLHGIICSKLRLPKESVLRGNFTSSSFKIDIVEDSDRALIQKKCESNNLTLEYVLEANKNLKGMNTQRKIEKLRRDLCKKVGVDEGMVDKYSVELKIKKKEKYLKRLRENRQKKKTDAMMKSIFYLPVRQKDLLKDLQNLQENSNLDFLQNHDTELTNGLLVDIFEAVKGDRIELRKVLCCRFTKLCTMKSKTLNEKVIEVVSEAEKLKESGHDEELKTYMNSAVFETIYSVKPYWTQTKEMEQDTAPEHSVGMENEKVSERSPRDDPAGTSNKPESLDTDIKVDSTFSTIEIEKVSECSSRDDPAGTSNKPESLDTDNNVDSTYSNLENIEDDEIPSLLLDVDEDDLDEEIDEDEDLDDQISSKNKRKAYDNAFKLKVVQFAEKSSNRATGRKFNIAEKLVRDWKKAKDELQKRPKNMRKNCSRAKDLVVLEKDLCNWYLYYQQKGIILGRREIRLKAKLLAKDPKYEIVTAKHLFGNSWCDGFLKTYNLTLSRNIRKVGAEMTTVNTKEGLSGSHGTGAENIKSEENEQKVEHEISTINFNKGKNESLKRETCGSYSDDTDDDLSLCEEVYIDVDEDVSKKVHSNSDRSELFVDEKTVPNAIECKVKLDMRRESKKTETDERSLHSDSNSESEVTGASIITKNSIVSDTGQNGTESGRKSPQTDGLVSSKGRKKKRNELDNAVKLKQFTEESGIKAAEEKFETTENDTECCNVKTLIEGKRKYKKRKARNLTDLEKDLVSWVQGMLNSGSDISAKLVATKARSLRDEGKYDIDPFEWKFSDQWAKGFLKRNALISDRKDISHKTDTVVNYSSDDTDMDIPSELLGIPYQSDANSEITDLEKTSGKKMRRQSYDNIFKRNVISFAESSGNALAVHVFNISEALVRKWRKSKEFILNGPDDRKRYCEKVGNFKELENDLVSWCRNFQKVGKELTRSTLMLKAKQLARKGTYSEDTSQFKASAGWCSRFLDRNDLHSYVVDGRSRKKPQHRKLLSELHTSITGQDNESFESTSLS